MEEERGNTSLFLKKKPPQMMSLKMVDQEMPDFCVFYHDPSCACIVSKSNNFAF